MDGSFMVDGVIHRVATNDGPNHLHGGIRGFDKCIWSGEIDGDRLKLTLHSKDGDEGYPGNLDITVLYSLTDDNELSIEYSAVTDKATPVSLTNHTYFNLGGFRDNILGHTARIASDRFLMPDESNVPVGEQFEVAGTVWDYNEDKAIGAVFAEQPMGFETYYVFKKPVMEFARVAKFKDPTSGRQMEVSTTEPGMLFYSGFYTSDDLKRECGYQYGQFRAFCCETSRYPNGPNIDGSPDSLLQPGDTYSQKTVFKFN